MYYGYYDSDQKHGWGVYRWADGRIYIGQWNMGKQDDTRVYVLPNGEVKKAKWDGDKKGPYLDIGADEKSDVVASRDQALQAANAAAT